MDRHKSTVDSVGNQKYQQGLNVDTRDRMLKMLSLLLNQVWDGRFTNQERMFTEDSSSL